MSPTVYRSPLQASAVFSGAPAYVNFTPPIGETYTSPVSPGGSFRPSASRMCTSRFGAARPTDPGFRSHSSGEIIVASPSVMP